MKSKDEILEARKYHCNKKPDEDNKYMKGYWEGVLFAYNWVLEEQA